MKSFFKFLQKPYIYILIVLIGISLKFYQLEEQFFWDDEVATILHTTGISLSEYDKNLPVNEIVSKSYYENLLKINEKNLNIGEQILKFFKTTL